MATQHKVVATGDTTQSNVLLPTRPQTPLQLSLWQLKSQTFPGPSAQAGRLSPERRGEGTGRMGNRTAAYSEENPQFEPLSSPPPPTPPSLWLFGVMLAASRVLWRERLHDCAGDHGGGEKGGGALQNSPLIPPPPPSVGACSPGITCVLLHVVYNHLCYITSSLHRSPHKRAGRS